MSVFFVAILLVVHYDHCDFVGVMVFDLFFRLLGLVLLILKKITAQQKRNYKKKPLTIQITIAEFKIGSQKKNQRRTKNQQE